MKKRTKRSFIYTLGLLFVFSFVMCLSTVTAHASDLNEYPKDSELTGVLNLSTGSTSVSGEIYSQEEKHTYKLVVANGKSVKLDIDLRGSGIGSPVTLSPAYAGGVNLDGDGVNVIKKESDYGYLDAIRSYGTEFNKKRTLYLNEGTYYLVVDACERIATVGYRDGKTIYTNGYGSAYTNYLAYAYQLNLKMTEVKDYAKGKQNGNKFKDSVDIKIGDKINGVVPMCMFGTPNANASVGGKSENYRFVLTKKTNVAAILSNYNNDAQFTWIGFYKETETPYYGSAVKTNESSTVYEEGSAYTKTHSLSAVLEPGTYFLYFEMNNGAFDETYGGTPYTLTLKDKTVSLKVSTVSLKTSYAYTGSALTPAFTVTNSGKTLKKGTDYTVKFTNNVNVGKATVKITGIGNYKDTITKTFKILPKSTDITKVTSKKGGFTATWTARKLKMKTNRITGYQIQYSKTKDFSSGNKITSAKGYVLSTKEVKNLPAGTYRVRIRTYMTVGGVNYYSAWSKAVSVKVK